MNDRLSRRPMILMVDDDDPLAMSLRQRVTAAGYRVQRAPSGHAALLGLEAAKADLILLSLFLPDMDGLILCAGLKALTNAPIVVLSDRGREVDRALAIESGAVSVIARACEIDGVLAGIWGARRPAPARN